MTKICYVLRYFVSKYPYKSELSKTRITKMVYLADWFSSKKYRKQITPIKWYFDHYGPYVSDVYDAARKDNKLIIEQDFSAYGSPKEVISLKAEEGDLDLDALSEEEVKILDDVIESTKQLNWSEFINFVYATYPIRTQERYSLLNLVKLAESEIMSNE